MPVNLGVVSEQFKLKSFLRSACIVDFERKTISELATERRILCRGPGQLFVNWKEEFMSIFHQQGNRSARKIKSLQQPVPGSDNEKHY